MSQSSENANEFQLLLKAISYYRTHWWVFVAQTILIFFLALVNFVRTPPTYESVSTLLIDSSRRQMYQSVVNPLSGNAAMARKQQSIVFLLTSQDVVERFRIQLNNLYNAEGRPNYLKEIFPRGAILPSEAFKQRVSLNWDKISDIYTIRCIAQNPEAAKDLCQTYLTTIQDYYPQIGQREFSLKRDFLTRQISSLTQQIDNTEGEIGDFQRRNEAFIRFMTLNIEGKGLFNLRREILELKQKLAANRAVERIMSKIPSTGDLNPLTTALAAMNARTSELQYQLFLTRQSPNPDKEYRIRAIKQEIGLLSAQISMLTQSEQANFIKNPISGMDIRKKVSELEMEYKVDIIKLVNLEKEVKSIENQDENFRKERLEYQRLQAELDNKRKLLTLLYSKQQESEIELSAGSSEIFKLQDPTVPRQRTAPNLTTQLYAAASFSVIAIIATTFLLILFVPRIDSESEVIKLNLPIFGKIPQLPFQIERGVVSDIPTFALEHLKIMNYRIARETKDVKCPIIMIGSSHTREGKSTVSQLLTLASRAPGRKTLLIDGDLLTTKPIEFFGIKEDHTIGLRSFLDDQSEQNIRSMIVKTVHDGISFLPRGGQVETTSLPNFLKPFEQVLNNFRNDYDLIIIDTPPLFASNLGNQWAGIADMIVLVARVYYTRPKDILESIHTCKLFSQAPVGVALNAVPITAQQRRVTNYYFSGSKSKTGKLAA